MARWIDDIDRELIRRAPSGVATHVRLMQLFGLSYSGATRIRNGTRGLPLKRGFACRPWELRDRELMERWRRRQDERTEALY
jgi:hypothetical protein